MRREVTILKSQNPSELKQRVIELEQEVSDAVMERKHKDQVIEMYTKQLEEFRSDKSKF